MTGIVTKVEWTNPHVWFYMNVKEPRPGRSPTGAPRWASARPAAQGWRRETMKIGEEVTVDGSMAKNGTKRMNASSVTMTATGGRPGETLDAESSGSGEQPVTRRGSRVPRTRIRRQTVRCGSGCCLRGTGVHVSLLAAVLGELGGLAQAPAAAPRPRRAALATHQRGQIDGQSPSGASRPRTSRPGAASAERQDPCWAARQPPTKGSGPRSSASSTPLSKPTSSIQSVGEGAVDRSSEARARASHALQGIGRFAAVPDAVRRRVRGTAARCSVSTSSTSAARIRSAPSTWTAGRTRRNVAPSYYGHSIGWWEGDTLVVETTGFNETILAGPTRTPPHRASCGRSNASPVPSVEGDSIRGDHRRPGRLHGSLDRLASIFVGSGQELFEYVCQQANYASELMVGEADSVDRATTIVP